ncbi:hypothetical protein [Paenibacillus campi]|uniref:hypothetical protein n=1 Tax=Paenibacillus campi TaxID=3106031 RepID=UPI002AFF525F|nr:hypothetical protein [Paenibacillus sp. SGZ-1014]
MLNKNHHLVKWLLLAVLVLTNFSLYQWTTQQAFMGDSLMHLTDDTQIDNLGDVIKTFYMTKNPAYHEQHRIEVMQRPIFNELLITFQKKLVGDHYHWLRWIALSVQSINSLLAFYLIYILTRSQFRSFVGALAFSFNPVYFYGLYEFGLSFSLWLTMFVLLTFIFVTKYIQQQSSYWLLTGSLFCLFLSLFTKESAMTLPFALIIFAILLRKKSLQPNQTFHWKNILKEWSWNDIFNRKIVFFSIGAIVLLILYLITRIIKLGSIFEIHAGLSEPITLFGVASKLAGYYLIAFNIPTRVIPIYMAIPINHYPIIIIIIAVLAFLFINYFVLRNILKLNLLTIAGLFIFVLLIAPVFKVSRNAPYYLDIPLIGILITVTTLKLSTHKVWLTRNKSRIFAGIAAFAVLFNIVFQYKMTNDMDIWLTKGEQYVDQFTKSVETAPFEDFNQKNIYMLSSFFSSDEYWIFNHAKVGSSFYYNLPSYQSNVDSFNEDKMGSLGDATLIDFYIDNHQNLNNPSGFTLQYETNIQQLKLAKQYPRQNVIQFNVMPHQLIEIKGKFTANVDRNTLRALVAKFTKQQNDEVDKYFSSYANVSPTTSGDDFTLYTLVPTDALQFTLDTTDISGAFADLSVKQYNIIKGANTVSANPKQQILKNGSFEQGVTDWVGLTKEQLSTDAKFGKYAAEVGPGPAAAAFQTISVVPGKTLLMDAWAKSATDTTGVGRLQINWQDKDGQFIDAFIHTIDVGSTYKDYMAMVKVPFNAAKAEVYISPHDDQSKILYDDVKLYQN